MYATVVGHFTLGDNSGFVLFYARTIIHVCSVMRAFQFWRFDRALILDCWIKLIHNGKPGGGTHYSYYKIFSSLDLTQRFVFVLSKEFQKSPVSLVRLVLSRRGVATMPHFDVKEFGEAGPYLRKTDLELLAAQNLAFDGISPPKYIYLWKTLMTCTIIAPRLLGHNRFCITC